MRAHLGDYEQLDLKLKDQRRGQKRGREPFLQIDAQQQIVAQTEVERALVKSNRKLDEIFEANIKAKLDEIWGGDDEN